MKKILTLISLFQFSLTTFSQLTVEKIMQEPYKWIGTSPSSISWAEDSKTIYFLWNPDKNKGDSLYKIAVADKKIVKVSPEERRALPSA